MKFSSKSKKIAIVGMVAIVLILGGMVLTSPMLDNSDPITSGQYMVSETPPEGDPYPQVEVKPEESPGPDGTVADSVWNEVIEVGKDALEKAEEFIDEKNENTESTPNTENNATKVGGLGLGTLFTLYVGYRFIFK